MVFYKDKNKNSWKTSQSFLFSAYSWSLSTLKTLVYHFGREFSSEISSLIFHHLRRSSSSLTLKQNVQNLMWLWKMLEKASKRLTVNQSPSKPLNIWPITKPSFKGVLLIQSNSNLISNIHLLVQIQQLELPFHLMLNLFWPQLSIQTYLFYLNSVH